MRNTSHKALLLAAAAVLALALAGCGSRNAKSEGPAGGGRQSVMIYSSLKESQLAALKDGFMKRHPNIAMDFYTASTGNVMTKLATEQQAGGIAADLIWVGDPTNYIDFKKQGLLYAYDSPAAADIPAKFKDPDRMFMSARLIMLGFVYNTRRLT